MLPPLSPADMLRHGFEWTIKNGPPISLPKYRNVHQPPCCALTRAANFLTCDQCWTPVYDVADNSTLPEDDPAFTDPNKLPVPR